MLPTGADGVLEDAAGVAGVGGGDGAGGEAGEVDVRWESWRHERVVPDGARVLPGRTAEAPGDRNARLGMPELMWTPPSSSAVST